MAGAQEDCTFIDKEVKKRIRKTNGITLTIWQNKLMEQSEEEAVYAHQEALKYVPVDKTSQ
jgi:hypothetical protein